MYNLLVSADENSWNGTPFEIDLSRCIREYTDRDIVEKYQDLTDEIVREIKRFPCLFVYESPCEKDPKFGLIRNVIKRRNIVSIEYDIIEIEPFLTYQDLNELSFRLDITGWELNRTHWAIKNVNLADELHAKGVILPQGITRDSKSVDITKHIFEVSLSFPGDVRDYVESVAFEYRSGTSVRGRTRVSHVANKKIKTALTQAAQNSVMYDPVLKEYYQRKMAEGKNRYLVLNNVRNKLIHRIFAVVRDGQKYDLNFTHPLKQQAA